MLKASQLVSFCLSMVGMPYWYGTCVYKCSADLLNRKATQYKSHYGSSRTAKYNEDVRQKLVCADCAGLIKGFFWTSGGQSALEAIGTDKKISSKYGGNGFPDKGANSMLTWCKSKGAKYGSIATLPDVPGVLLFASGHVGVYVGSGYAVEARDFKNGIVKTKVADRSWTNWAYIPKSVMEYDTDHDQTATPEAPAPIVPPATETTMHVYKLGDRTIQRGTKGEDVVELQTAFVRLGYDLGTFGANKDGIDGDCGSKTILAIKDFQRKNGLAVDGKFGKKSYAMLQQVLSGCGNGFQIRVNAWSVNVRNAPVNGDVIRVVRMNQVLEAMSVDAATGWYCLIDGNYISNEYTTKV